MQISLRELLPSESQRRRHSLTDIETSPPLGEGSRSYTPSEQSPFSPAGEDSFYMVRTYTYIVCKVLIVKPNSVT